MRYVSPFEELGIEIDGNLNKENLNLAKKRLLAELDLSDAPTILRGSVEMTKNDIIIQFDKLASVKNWDFHRLIAADKALLDFIQHKDWSEGKQLLKEPKYDDAAFIDFVSPYFSESYKYLIIKHLSNRSLKNLTAILDITPRLLTEDDHDDVWFSVESFLEGWKDNLNEIAENVRNGQQYSDKELIPYQAKQFIQCLNLLPDDFMWFRDDYATSLFNLSAYSWNKEKHYRAIDIVKNARLLEISNETEAMLDERIAWFEEQIGRSNTSNSSNSSESWSGATIFRILLFVIFLFVRLATCGHSGTTITSPNLNLYEAPPPPMELATSSPETDALAEKYTKQALAGAGKTAKKMTKQRFDAILDFIKKTETATNNKLMHTLLIDSSLRDLLKLKETPLDKRSLSLQEIDSLIMEFKVLQREKGLE